MSKENEVFNSHRIITITKVVAKIAEVACWMIVIGTIVTLGWLVCSPDSSLATIAELTNGEALNCFGFALSPADGVSLTSGMVIAFMIVGMLLSSLMAMTFRNTYLILKTAAGKSWFAKSDTPFQKDIVRMLREIGFFLIGLPIVSLLAMLIIGGIYSNVELSSTNVVSFVLGLLMLCLSQFFGHGVELEEDTKGLI